MPGCGKSTVGRLLAAQLGRVFVDCDAAFEVEVGQSIAEWVAEQGWSALRERESKLLGEALSRNDCVIATGGGVVEDEQNRSALAEHSMVVWLDAPLDALVARLGEAADRPLLVAAPRERLESFAERRNPLYGALADLRIDVGDLDPAHVADKIVHTLDPSLFGRSSG